MLGAEHKEHKCAPARSFGYRARMDSSRGAKRLMVQSFGMPCQGDCFTEILLFNGDGANGPDVWKDRFSFAAAPRRESCESDNHPAKLKFRAGRWTVAQSGFRTPNKSVPTSYA